MYHARWLPLRVVEGIQQVNLRSRCLHVIVHAHPLMPLRLVCAGKSLRRVYIDTRVFVWMQVN